ncbi:MAG: VIT1/CCC1 transporter family protein [Candidatus Aenigmarchaeota archaeon]|nr:VIT1/CCC1 transporter family protein [Candidatus Aenigmarchaeota archaeon]
MPEYEKHFRGEQIGNIILGGQDGLVNVLAVVLGVASATNDVFIVLVAGLAATFAETISMAAVAYTSTKADWDYYKAERALEENAIKENPKDEIKEIREIYAKKGFKGRLLNDIVKIITSNEKVWVDTMMSEELNLSPKFGKSPIKNGLIVFVATLVGSIVPLVPFVFLPISNAMIASVIIAVAVLFAVGVVKAKLTVGNWLGSGLELALIGTLAAISGYFIGIGLGALFGTNVVGVG